MLLTGNRVTCTCPFLQAPLRSPASTAMPQKQLSSPVQTGQAVTQHLCDPLIPFPTSVLALREGTTSSRQHSGNIYLGTTEATPPLLRIPGRNFAAGHLEKRPRSHKDAEQMLCYSDQLLLQIAEVYSYQFPGEFEGDFLVSHSLLH